MHVPPGVLRRGTHTASLCKTIIASLLSLSFVVDPVGWAFSWISLKKTIVKKDVRKRITAGIEVGNLVLLKFKKEETGSLLRWEHSGEFEYNGQMYDVVETWTQGNTVYYRCWRDEEETRLNSQLKETVARALGEAPKVEEKSTLWSSSLKSSCFIITKERKILPPGLFREPLRALSDFYSSIVIRPPTPPPRLA